MNKENKKIRLIKKSNSYIIEMFSKGIFCRGKWVNPSIFQVNGHKPRRINDFAVLNFNNNIDEANFVYDFLLKNEYLDEDCISLINGYTLSELNKKAKVEDEILRCD